MTDNQPKTEEKPEAKPEEKKKEVKTIATSPKLAKLIEEVEKLSVIELADLVKALEEKFGVSATVPMAAAPSGSAGPAEGGQAQAGAPVEKSTFTIILTAAGEDKIGAIKAVREINQTLGLKEAKDLVESAPKEVAKDVDKQTAEDAKKKLEAVGAKVELK